MTSATIQRLLAALWRPLAALLGGLGLYAKGRADAKARRDLRDARAEIETRRRADAAEIVGNDPDAAARWLRERGQRDGGL